MPAVAEKVTAGFKGRRATTGERRRGAGERRVGAAAAARVAAGDAYGATWRMDQSSICSLSTGSGSAPFLSNAS